MSGGEHAAGGERAAHRSQQMVVVGVIASAVGIAIGLIIHWFPPADSTQADKIDTLWDVLIIAPSRSSCSSR